MMLIHVRSVNLCYKGELQQKANNPRSMWVFDLEIPTFSKDLNYKKYFYREDIMLTYKECQIAISNVFNFLDTIDLTSYLEKYKNKEVYDLQDELEEKYPYQDEYSATLFDCVAVDEFCGYLDKRYGANITSEETVTKWYIR